MKEMSRRYAPALFGFLLALFSAVPALVFAASLSFSPSSQTVSVGQNFTVSVDVSSPDQAMNAASGDVSFPSDQLRVLSVSNRSSVMSLWVQNPTFSNAVSGGDVNFAGVVLNPGFTGVNGNVITIRFQAVGTGNAPLSFSAGSVLANDGNGTDILSSLGTASVTITPASPSTPRVPPTGAPVASTTPTITPTTTVPVIVPSPILSKKTEVLLFLLLAAIVLLILYVAYRLYVVSRRLTAGQKELRSDLARIERELSMDSSVSDTRKRIREEVEHLKEDIKKDT